MKGGANPFHGCATPTFSMSGGTYTTEVSPVVMCETAGATIHYALNGSDPTDADPTVASAGSILIDASRTLTARAWKAGMR